MKSEEIREHKNRVYYGHLKASKANPYLRDAADQIFIPHILNMDIPAGAITNLKNALNEDTGKMTLHSFGMGIRAINMAELKRPQDFILPIHSWSETECLEWVSNRNWQIPWRASIEVLHMAMPLLLNGAMDSDAFFETLEAFQDPGGGWGDDSPHNQMGAAFHFVPLYRHTQRPMPRCEVLTRYIRKEEPQGTGFGVMDALYLLSYAVELEIIAQEDVNLEGYWKTLSYEISGSRHEYVASAQTLSLLAEFDGNAAFNDGWDPQLWKV